jgi:hypothetical protein
MNRFKYLTAATAFLSALFIVTLSTIVYADCEHCYTVARVSVVLNTGDNINGYIPVFGSDIPNDKYEPMVPNSDLLRKFTLKVRRDSITFIDTFYTIPNVGYVVCTENIRKLPCLQLKKVLFKKWIDDFSGACELPNIPQKTLKQILSSPTLCAYSIKESCSDRIYVNIDSTLSKDDFTLFMEYSPGSQFDTGGLRTLFNAYSADRMTSAQYLNFIEDEIITCNMILKSITVNYTNKTGHKDIDDYFAYLEKDYGNMIRFYQTTCQYLKDSNKITLTNFFSNVIDDDSLKICTIRFINSDDDINANIRHSLQAMLLIDEQKKQLFEAVITNNHIINYTYWWD